MHNSAEGGGGGENQIARESEKVLKIFAVDLVNITLGRVSPYLQQADFSQSILLLFTKFLKTKLQAIVY